MPASMDISSPAAYGEPDGVAAAEKAREAECVPSTVVRTATPSPQPSGLNEMDSRAVERRVRRKLDRVLLPLVFTAYMVAFLDRSNLGNAEAAGMSKDLGFSDEKYQVRDG